MSVRPRPDQPVYPVGSRRLSLLDLLETFLDPAHFERGISRYSDLHVKVGEAVRYRYDGDLVAVEGAATVTAEMAEVLIGAMLEPADAGRLAARPPVDVDCAYAWPERSLNFRVNAFRDKEGLAAAIRVLPAWIPPVDQLGFPDPRVPRDIVAAQQGFVIVTGVTGSGKSTTIASFLQHITQHRPVRVITLEDPIEYALPTGRALVSQREVGRDVTSFSEGLRSALREDPDVIFVGEVRDRETASLALTAAETGHLVVTTLHTRDSKGAITRLLDLFPAERGKELASQLSFALGWVIAQRLVERAGGKGRRVAFEVLRNTVGVSNIIRTGNWQQIYSMLETQQREGMTTLEKHLTELALTGEITPEEAARQANDVATVQRLLNAGR